MEGVDKSNEYDKVSATGTNVFKKGFSKENLDIHFGKKGKHTAEYPGWSAEKYEKEALKLVQSAVSDDILGYKTSKGAVARYRISTNDYVKGYPKTGIATMFKPKNPERYYKNRLKAEKGVEYD